MPLGSLHAGAIYTAQASAPTLDSDVLAVGRVPVATNPALLALQSARNVLLLQGPLGPFFDRLTQWLLPQGKRVLRVAFQGGDLLDSTAAETLQFRGTLAQWPEFVGGLLDEHDIDVVVLFGQARAYHAAAIKAANMRERAVIVMEEGYFRPGFVTMELDGVNGFSRTMTRYRWSAEAGLAAGLQPDITPRHFQKMAVHAARHYVSLWARRHHFSGYRHHRQTGLWHYSAFWLRSWKRKLMRRANDLCRQTGLIESGLPYYVVPLQNDGDSQITHHSPYGENAAFVMEVMRSFAWHAPEGSRLVFRGHPYARGGHAHRRLIASVAYDLGIRARVVYLTEGDTPLLAQHSSGVVVINSTVGLQALERGAPLMALGESIYRALTYQGPLDRFWAEAKPADQGRVDEFLSQLKNLTQMPASVYAQRGEPLRWPLAGE